MRVIKHGNVLIGDEIQNVDILFDEKGIQKIAPVIEGDYEVIDAEGLVVLPGLIDVHVHLREPGFTRKETIETGTLAAAKGGFTTIFAMPNVIPFPDHKEVVEEYLAKIESKAKVHTYPYACITKEEKGKEVVDMHELKKLGIHHFSDDGVGVHDDMVMLEAIQKAEEEDVMLVAHAEDMKYRKPGASVHESEITREKGWIGIPGACETEPLKRDLNLLKGHKTAYHACHISAKESVEALRQVKEEGLNVSGEVTAHHLLLEDKDVTGTNHKMNPPLRSHEDRMALIEGLEKGYLDFIASDHAPHTREEKEKPMEEAPFGIVSLETSFALLYSEFVEKEKRWTLPMLVNWMSTAPAKRFGLKGVGEIKEGYRADLILVDLKQEYTIDINDFVSMGKNTPFHGWNVSAMVKETIVDGKTIWKG